MQVFQEMAKNNHYSSINNAEFAPEVANEFVTVYLDDPLNNKGRLSRADAIDLTQHMCNWMFGLKLTCSKICMSSAPSASPII